MTNGLLVIEHRCILLNGIGALRIGVKSNHSLAQGYASTAVTRNTRVTLRRNAVARIKSTVEPVKPRVCHGSGNLDSVYHSLRYWRDDHSLLVQA